MSAEVPGQWLAMEGIVLQSLRCRHLRRGPTPRSVVLTPGYYPPANFFLATGRANAFVGPCPLFAITLP